MVIKQTRLHHPLHLLLPPVLLSRLLLPSPLHPLPLLPAQRKARQVLFPKEAGTLAMEIPITETPAILPPTMQASRGLFALPAYRLPPGIAAVDKSPGILTPATMIRIKMKQILTTAKMTAAMTLPKAALHHKLEIQNTRMKMIGTRMTMKKMKTTTIRRLDNQK